MSAIAISLATPADVHDVLAMLKRLAEYTRESDHVTATADELATALRDERFSALLARDGSQVIGIATFYNTYSTWMGAPGLNLDDLFVLAPYRARGVGKRLLGRLGQVAEERGCARVEWMVHCVGTSTAQWNEPAIAFYEQRLGATPAPELRKERLEGVAAIRRLAALAE